MLKQTSIKITKGLAILLAVLFIVSVTAAAVSAKPAAVDDKKIVTIDIDNGQIKAAKGMAIGNENGEIKAVKGMVLDRETGQIIKALTGISVGNENGEIRAAKGLAVNKETGEIKAAKGIVINRENGDDQDVADDSQAISDDE